MLASLSSLAASAALLLLSSSPSPASAQSSGGANITSCSWVASSVHWTNISWTPANPQAGDTVIVNATGVASTAVTGGSGSIDAYIYGVDMFSSPISTCGVNQQIDIDGATTAVINALPCPVSSGQQTVVSVVIPVPQEAQGLGQLNITLQASDSTSRPAYCFDVSLSL
jgi:hypothetical protein